HAATTAAIQQLPGAITLAFAPYGRDLQDNVDQARAAGHEVLLQIPMEPIDYPTNDPGPHTLLTTVPARENLGRLDWLLGRFTGYVGTINYMGSRFTASAPSLRPVLIALRDRGLMFVDARSSPASVVIPLARDIGLPAVPNDRYIDNEASRAAIDARLQELERLAKAHGQALGVCFPYPVTIERLAQWSRGLDAKGIDLAPASALLVQEKARG
ncbi:MAG TPA: divergent polysaccharide deacetylase family protein, partial [Alphaproteobacteria bacterium]|nr:divergent polysaccharide deacetylase family protein [Alphaproteobacteria bacterium]